MIDELREAILEGAYIELVHEDTGGWVAYVGELPQTVYGQTAGEVLLRLADIVVGPRLQ